LNEQPMLWAMARDNIVLATPGTSSNKMWPSANSPATASVTCGSLPTMTVWMLAMMRHVRRGEVFHHRLADRELDFLAVQNVVRRHHDVFAAEWAGKVFPHCRIGDFNGLAAMMTGAFGHGNFGKGFYNIPLVISSTA
jgi:hypothetical protein